VLASHLTEALVKPVGPAGASGWSRAAARDVERIAAEIASEALVMAVGPGMGRSNEARECAVYLASAIRRPLVLDADGIVAFDDHLEVLAARDAPTILTPHPGEAARVVGAFDGRDDRERLEAATRLATSARAVVVLKGHRSVITDGETTAINETGNPGMATGGSGDVLTGLIAGLLACGMEPFDAARLGAHLHGAAGDLAAQEVGVISLVAEDIVRCLPSAIVRHQSGSH
jgi:NAD(P)H-hydrate epimerase